MRNVEEVKRYILEKFGENPILLIGCRNSKWQWPVCGYDFMIFTSNIRGYDSRKMGENIVNLFYVSFDNLEDRKSYSIWQKLISGSIINDPNLLLTRFREEALKKSKEIFLELYNEHVLSLTKYLAYCEESYEHEAYASTAYWITCIGYEAVRALNLLNKTDTSPSHLIQQVKDNPLLREPTYFVDITNFLGLEFASQTSYKRIFSTLDIIRKFSEMYKFIQLPPTEGYKITYLISETKIEEMFKKCEHALKEHMQLNAHIIATTWFIETVSELYQTICMAENVPQYKPKIIEELESRRKKLIGEGASIKNSILHEINPYTLKKNIEGARKLAFWLRRTWS